MSQLKNYKAYLFDWDGTIVRTLEAWMIVVRETLEAHGLHGVSDDKIVESLGKLKPTALEIGISEADIEAFMRDVELASHREIPAAELYENALMVLETLKNSGAKLALITSSWRTTLSLLLEKHQLNDIFDVVISGDDVENTKPDPEGINRAIGLMGINKKDAVMVGDTVHDMRAATNAGIDSILFYPPSHQLFYELETLKGHGPTRVVAGLEELV